MIRVMSRPGSLSRQGSYRDLLPHRDLALVAVALPVALPSRRLRRAREHLVCLGCFRGRSWHVDVCPKAGLPLGPSGGNVTPNRWFCRPFLGAVCGVTGGCSSLTLWRSKVAVLVVRRSFSRGCSVSLVVTPGCSFMTSWRCVPRCCFRIVLTPLVLQESCLARPWLWVEAVVASASVGVPAALDGGGTTFGVPGIREVGSLQKLRALLSDARSDSLPIGLLEDVVQPFAATLTEQI
ncbi:hypothetical protein Taro_024423 [Colocasia esculenta]|uniref:Uncharacterized protein n=1 Tax=Colocasia esculenta TaxID=4460 RepID=A0A843V0A9_COLES|nr:hypothetical protein [Colocasia esculenta]